MYFGLSLKQAGEANWTAPAFISLGVLAVALWHEAAQTSRWKAQFAMTALAVGVVMSVLILNTDVVRMLGIPWRYDKDPGARLRGWRTAAITINDVRKKFEAQNGKPAFLIANKYQTAASLGFYLPEKRTEAPGHPPVYIPESQNIENQFSFFPRYDEMADLRQVARDFLKSADPGGAQTAQRKALADALGALPNEAPDANDTAHAEAQRRFAAALHAALPNLPIDEYYTEEGISFFTGRDALYVTDRSEEHAPSSVERGFERTELIALFEIKRRNLPLRELRIFACHNYRGLPL
jgi:hypothetical protein